MNAKIESTCDRFDQAEAKLKSFTRSAVRTKIMLCLMSGEKDAGELEEAMCLRASTILHSIKEMIDAGLIVKAARGYALTNIGRIEARLLDNLVSTIVALDQHRDFWLTHDLSGIPTDLQMKIGMLAQSERITADSSSPLRSLENFMSELAKSNEIRGFSPIIVSGFQELIADGVMRGSQIDLILTDSILNILAEKDREILRQLQKSENFRLYHIDIDARVAFTVTESLIALGLFRIKEGVDLTSELICYGENATKWGKMLFEHYRSMSEPANNI